MRSTTKATVEKARALRPEMSPPEAALWQVLRTRPEGVKFRRQHPVGPFVVDFYCPSAKLVVEIDGISMRWATIPNGMRNGISGWRSTDSGFSGSWPGSYTEMSSLRCA